MILVPISWLWIGLAAGVALTVGVGRLFGRYPLKTRATPHQIVDFELAGDKTQAAVVLRAWAAENKLGNARRSLLADMAWILCYTLAMICGCALAASQFPGRYGWVAGLIVAAQPVAGALDYAENLALLRVLREFERGGEQALSAGPPRLAALCASLKFRLIGAGLVLVLVGLLAWLLA